MRNPLKDPMPGDVVKDNWGDYNVVTHFDDSSDMLEIIIIGSTGHQTDRLSLSTWRDMTGSPEPSEVIYAAE
jgi:hypothetical protein